MQNIIPIIGYGFLFLAAQFLHASLQTVFNGYSRADPFTHNELRVSTVYQKLRKSIELWAEQSEFRISPLVPGGKQIG